MFKGMKAFLALFSLLILCASYFIYSSLELSYEEIELNDQNSKARCMDGSPYKFLLSKGFGNGTDSFLLFFEQGGFCGDNDYESDNIYTVLPSCKRKQSNPLGTNKFALISRYFISYVSRLFSTKQSINPNFYNWNKVFVKYCDGAIFQGNHEEPFTYKNSKIYIRGEYNVKELLHYLIDNLSFNNSSRVLVSGSSAGGIGALMWSNYIKSLAPKADFKVICDSGFFLNENISFANTNIMKDMITRLTSQLQLNYSEIMSYYCPYKDESWKCFFPQYFIHNIKNNYPILAMTSLYDSWALSHIISTTCFFGYKIHDGCNSTELAKFEQYANLIYKQLLKISDVLEPNQITLWLPKGYYHMFIFMNLHWTTQSYAVDGYTVFDLVNDWYNNRLNPDKKIYVDKEIQKYHYDVYWLSKFFTGITKLLFC